MNLIIEKYYLTNDAIAAARIQYLQGFVENEPVLGVNMQVKKGEDRGRLLTKKDKNRFCIITYTQNLPSMPIFH